MLRVDARNFGDMVSQMMMQYEVARRRDIFQGSFDDFIVPSEEDSASSSHDSEQDSDRESERDEIGINYLFFIIP